MLLVKKVMPCWSRGSLRSVQFTVHILSCPRTAKCAVSSRSFCLWAATSWSSVLSLMWCSSPCLSHIRQRSTSRLCCRPRNGPAQENSTSIGCKQTCKYVQLWSALTMCCLFLHVTLWIHSTLSLLDLIHPVQNSSNKQRNYMYAKQFWQKLNTKNSFLF